MEEQLTEKLWVDGPWLDGCEDIQLEHPRNSCMDPVDHILPRHGSLVFIMTGDFRI